MKPDNGRRAVLRALAAGGAAALLRPTIAPLAALLVLALAARRQRP